MAKVVEVGLHRIARGEAERGDRDEDGASAHETRLSGANRSTHFVAGATYIYEDSACTRIAWSSRMRAILTVVAVAGSVIACSGGSDNTGTSNGASTGAGGITCESTGKRLCERACSCGSECKTAFLGTSDAVTTFTWSDQADCEAAFAGSRCRNGGPAGVDYAKCDADITAAVCESGAIVDPPSCEAKKDAG